jgi:hypothetical protein
VTKLIHQGIDLSESWYNIPDNWIQYTAFGFQSYFSHCE